MSNGFEEADEIPRLLQYLRIRSVQPTPDYASCVSFLVKLANGLRLTHQVHYFNNKPLLVMTRQGAEPALPSLLLTSHMDVVPVTTVPFSQTWPPCVVDTGVGKMEQRSLCCRNRQKWLHPCPWCAGHEICRHGLSRDVKPTACCLTPSHHSRTLCSRYTRAIVMVR